MKKMNAEKRENFKQFIKDLLETKFSHEKIMEKYTDEEIDEIMDSMEDEVLVEPFAFLDDDGNVIPYEQLMLDESTLGLIEDEDVVVNEEEIVYKDNDIEEKIKEIAEEIEPIDDLMIEINDGEKCLMNKVNCNIKNVPLLNSYFVTNLDIEIIQVVMNDVMEKFSELDLTVMMKFKDKYLLCKLTLGELEDAGLIKVFESWEDFEMSNVEYRGLTAKLDPDELVKLLDFPEELPEVVEC